MNNNIKRKELMSFYCRITGKKYFPNWEKSFSQLGTNVLRTLLLVMMMVTGVNLWGQTTYSFYVINNNGKQSVKATASVESTSTVLDAFKATTTSVLSPLIASDADYYFYDTEAEATAATGFTSGGGNGTSTIATVDADNDKNIYVRYYYNNNSSPIDLSGSIQHNIMIGGRYLVFNLSRDQRVETIEEDNVTPEMLQSTDTINVNINNRYQKIYFLWKFTGNDPYNITVTSCYNSGDKFLWGKWHATNGGSGGNMWLNNGTSNSIKLGSIQPDNTYKSGNDINIASFILLTHNSGTDYVLMAATTKNQPNNSSQYAYQRNANSTTVNATNCQNPRVIISTAANAQVVSITPTGECESPTITYDNSTGTVSIESATPGATVYYTVDGSTEPSSSATRYTEPFSISATTIIKAIAIRTGIEDSEVVTQTIEKLVSPSLAFVDATQKVSVTTNSEVEGAKSVYTTDGNNPTPSSTEYSEGISLTETSTVKAMTVKNGYINSDPVSLTVTKLASSPTISMSGGTVTLSYSDPGATIHYVTDGTTPSLESSSYSDPFSLVGNQKFTIKAIATKTGCLHSDVVEDVIDNRSTIPAPSISVEGNTVTITANDIGDEIYYTTDGSTPTTETATHFTTSGSFSLESGSSYTIKAIASYGNISSAEATETVDLTDSGYAGIYYIQSSNREYFMYPVGGESTYVKTAKNSDKNAIWKIERVGDYYRIIHYEDNKYLVAEDATVETNTVSLVETGSPGESALFEITRKSGSETDIFDQIILFRPKAAANASGHIYLNTTSGNNGTNTIGLWDNTGSSEWRLGKVPLSPTFTVADIKVTMANTLGDVYYTIDGSKPTTSSTKGKSVTLNYGPSYTVKAISIYTDPKSGEAWQSDVASKTVKVDVLAPTFSISGNTVQLRSSQEGMSFRYTTDDGVGLTETTGEAYNNTTGIVLTNGNAYNLRVLAYNTVSGTVYKSAISTIVVDLREAVEITSLAGIVSPTGNYKLASSFTATGTPSNSIGTSSNPFKGTIDGQLNELSLSQPLFDYVEDAIIKNVIVSNATISTSGNAGAIANNASGATRIYNCGIKGGTVSGSAYTGGLVGLLDGSARVINCYSYAEITGGSYVGGIVGYNNVATTSANLKTMVMNCMFYGDITGGSNKAPVYNGQIITNVADNGVSNFNYFCAEALYVQNRQIDTYNCALMAEKRFLQRFEFFRHLLNSNRELAAWWATGNMNKDQMMKWVMEPSQISSDTPYPILKTPDYYPSVVNFDAENATTTSEHNKGGKLGTLTVNIQMGSGGNQYGPPTGAEIRTTSLTLNITDKDPDHFNFNYYKVQLPYYNDVGTNNYTGNRVVTGWKIVQINGGTTGSLTTGADVTFKADGSIDKMPYNFADRKCTAKDLYNSSTNKRVFNQGAYWDVPEGVTSITIEPYWGKAVYLADEYADIVYNTSMTSPHQVPNVGGGQQYVNGMSKFNGQFVYTSMSNAIASSGSALYSGIAEETRKGHTVYDYAVVLVGNYHHIASIESGEGKPYTVTSVDLDGDNEPDYSFILRFNGRTVFHPVRYDFLNLIGLGMAQKSTGGPGSYNFGIMQPKYWFEVTNTALFRVTQFEYDLTGRGAYPIIIHGGVFEQWVAAQTNTPGNKIPYFHIGGNAWFKEFQLGVHQDNDGACLHSPISITGGDFGSVHLTNLYKAITNFREDNAECYINGGRFGAIAGAGMEGIGKPNGADNTGNIFWQIDNADIDEFYGGGINAVKPVRGNIRTYISNSRVGIFCGGPKFGDMSANKTVITTATNCTFGIYFGAGYGGTSYSRFAPKNYSDIKENGTHGWGNIDWNAWVNGTAYPTGGNYGGYNQDYNSGRGGVSTQIDYQFLPMSGNESNVMRIFLDYASFSLATTHSVTSTLTGCTITGNFYGGGSLGKVSGSVTSTLDNCTVKGNVFGAGYSASLPSVDVMNKGGFITPPYYDSNLGVYLEAELPASVPYTWEHRDEVNSTATAIDTDNHKLFTTVNLDKSNLGSVAGNVILTIKGNSVIGTKGDDTKGNVFGGGEQSYVTKSKDNQGNPVANTGNTAVNLQGNTEVLGNVYGGGDQGVVEGSATVNIEDEEEEPAEP